MAGILYLRRYAADNEKQEYEEKARYLQTLFDKIYPSDIMERNKMVYEKSVLDDYLNIISSSIGSLTNASIIANTFKSTGNVSIRDETVSRYMDLFIDAFMIYKAERYDVKGSRRYYVQSALTVADEGKGILYVGIQQFLLDERAMDIWIVVGKNAMFFCAKLSEM